MRFAVSHHGDESKIIRISIKELEGMVLVAAKTAVQELQTSAMAKLGVNINNDESVEEFKATMQFARNLHTGSTKVGARVSMTIITVITGAIAIASWEWVKSFISSMLHHP